MQLLHYSATADVMQVHQTLPWEEGLACEPSLRFVYTLFQFALVSSLCASLDAAGQPLEKRVLKEYRARILKVVAVNKVYRELRDKNVIDDDVEKAITLSQTEDKARGYLFDHMMEYGNLKSLKDFCHVITSEDYMGNPAMQDLGRDMKKTIEKG